MTQEVDREQARMQHLCGAWKTRFRLGLKKLMDDTASTRDGLADLVWTEAVLEQVSPADPETRAARQEMKSPLWMPRDDPRFYWRVAYALAHARFSSKAGWTVDAGMPMSAAIRAVEDLVYAHPQGAGATDAWFQAVDRPPGYRWVLTLCDLLIERAQAALRATGAVPHEPMLERGWAGTHRNIPCTLERFRPDGLLWLSGRSPADMIALHALMGVEGTNGICPSTVDAKRFRRPL